MSYNAKNYTEQGGDVTHFGGTVVFEEGATVTGLSANPLTAATADTLGGIKVGSNLQIASGVLTAKDATADAKGVVKMAANQAASTATTVANVKEDLNTLLAALKTAGIMVADSHSA